VTQYEQVKRLVDHAVQSHGRIDVIINNAGLMPVSPLDRLKVQEGLRQEVKSYNIRSTVISPGMVATELVDSITEPDIAANVRKRYEGAVPAESFANMVAFAISQPDDVEINEIVFRPTSQEYSGCPTSS